VDRLDATIPEATIRDPGPTTEHQEDASYNNSSVLNLAVSDLRQPSPGQKPPTHAADEAAERGKT
jgi:hypothetical protein